MQKELFDEIVISGEDNFHSEKLTYYMITDSVREEYCDLKVYGAEIEKAELSGGIICQKEHKTIKNLFFRYSEAEKFLKKIASEKVTPDRLNMAVSNHIREQIRRITYEG